LNGNSYIAVGAYDNTQYSGSGTINPVIGVSNFDYETIKNEEKREIFLLKSEYIQQYLNDFRNIMNYTESSQYVDRKLIRTENTRLIS
jgi:hypothetical protein